MKERPKTLPKYQQRQHEKMDIFVDNYRCSRPSSW